MWPSQDMLSKILDTPSFTCEATCSAQDSVYWHASCSWVAVRLFAMLALLARGLAVAAPVYDQVAVTWTDDYADTSGLASKSGVDVDPADGQLKLTNSGGGFAPPYNASGEAITTSIIPTSVAKWKNVALTAQAPTGTSLKIQVLDESDLVYPDARLPGNEAGFEGAVVDLTGLPVDSVAGIQSAKFARLRSTSGYTTS